MGLYSFFHVYLGTKHLGSRCGAVGRAVTSAPEILSSNPVTGNIMNYQFSWKDENKEKEAWNDAISKTSYSFTVTIKLDLIQLGRWTILTLSLETTYKGDFLKSVSLKSHVSQTLTSLGSVSNGRNLSSQEALEGHKIFCLWCNSLWDVKRQRLLWSSHSTQTILGKLFVFLPTLLNANITSFLSSISLARLTFLDLFVVSFFVHRLTPLFFNQDQYYKTIF